MRRSLAALSLSGALLAGGAAGVLVGNPILSGAQSTTTTPAATPSTPSPTAGAEKGAWMSSALAPLVSAGTITQAQADAVIKALEAGRPSGGPGGHQGGRGMNFGMGLDAAAKALGMTAADLRTALQGGQTLGQVADSKGVSRTALVDALVAEAKTHLDAEVTAGRITQADEDAKLAEAKTRITEQLDRAMPAMPAGGPMGHGGHMGPGGPMGAPGAPAGGSTTSTTTA